MPSLYICSGGQTGIDHSALDVALELGLFCGGWAPKGKRCENGIISDTYIFIETKSTNYKERTFLNVLESSATLIFLPENSIKCIGTFLTIKFVKENNKPYYISNIKNPNYKDILFWLNSIEPEILNIAGPRESKFPGIYKEGKYVISKIIKSYI